jgi:hypothetical protein
MNNNYYLIPKSNSPYATLDFPNGIPVAYPLPVQMGGDNLIWDVDLNQITAKHLDGLANLVATARGVGIDTVISGIKADGKFGICLNQIERVVGDSKIEAMSMYEIEALARACRAKLLLTRSRITITLNISVLDAIALYSDLGQAVLILGSNDPQSESAELVGNWLDTILPRLAVYAPGVAQVLIDKQEQDDDQLLALFELIDSEIEMNVAIPCYTAYLVIACLQLILRSSERTMLDDVRHYIRALSGSIVQIAPEVNWLLERGWHPEFDGGGE